MYVFNNWCWDDDEPRELETSPCSDRTRWLSPGKGTNSEQDWDGFRVDGGWSLTVEWDDKTETFDRCSSGSLLVKVPNDNLATIRSQRYCRPAPPENPPSQTCSTPSSWPTAKHYINIFTTAPAYLGTSTSCAGAGTNYTSSNPQYVFCRAWGEEVRDSSGNYNHWWLWTDLDTGGRGWIPAYYIQGQGNDQADDMNTGAPIPTC